MVGLLSTFGGTESDWTCDAFPSAEGVSALFLTISHHWPVR